MTFKDKLLFGGIIAVIFIGILAVAGIGSVGSSAGHFLKDSLNGTPIEQPAASIEDAGNDLIATAHHTFAIFTGFLVVVGLIWIGSKR